MGADPTHTTGLDLVEIHDAHAAFVFRALQRFGVQESDLDDAVQEVFVVVHKKLGTVRGSARITTWLYGVALRVAYRFRRTARRRREDPGELDQSHVPDSRPGPDSIAFEREAREQLAAVLDGMDPPKRAVLVMFELERLSTAEIAAELGVPVGTVYSRLSAARAQFERAVVRLRKGDEA
jgi:RNA polymerase sigma-70 factor (ECF subfamily)